MTIGVGGSTATRELAAMKSMRGDAPPIDTAERQRRIERAQALMQAQGIDAIWLDVSTSLTYFTGLRPAAANGCTAHCCRRRAVSRI